MYSDCVSLLQDILRVRHIHPESGTTAAGAAGTAGAAAAALPAAAAIHGDERARGHPDSRHRVRLAGAEAHLRRQNRLYHPLLHKGRAYRTHHLYHQHGAGATDGTGVSRLLSSASALSALPLRWLDLDLIFDSFVPFAIHFDCDQLLDRFFLFRAKY